MNQMDMSNWKILRKFLKDSLRKPLEHPSFVFYFIVVILLLSSIGLISEVVKGTYTGDWVVKDLTINTANIFIALIAASSVEFILIKDEDLQHPFRKSDIQIFGVTFLIFGFLLWMLANYLQVEILGFLISLLGLICAYLFWWISNSGNTKLIIPDQPKSTVGGDYVPDKDLSGDVSKFKTN